MKLQVFAILAVVAMLFSAATVNAGVIATNVAINETRIDDDSGDTDEYFELVGVPGTGLDGLFYIVIGDGSSAQGSGVLERVIDLAGLSIPADGFFLGANSTLGTDVPAGSIDLQIPSNAFENSDNVTHLLVAGLTATAGTDLDDGDTGTVDTPWLSVLDGFSLFEESGGELLYASQFGLPTIGPDGDFVPTHVYRLPDGTGNWFIGPFISQYDTPGTANIPEPSTLAMIALGAGFAGIVGLPKRWG
jgi:hypothetical protein